MKVYLPAIAGHVPRDMVRTFRAFLEFCYIVRREVLTENDLVQLDDAQERFLQYREIFRTSGVRPDGFNRLPRQHSVWHYPKSIRMFGAPNGLCSSITESKHIKAVKEPWRRSNRYDALGQMLLTNQRLDKLAACRVDFTIRGMLSQTCLSDALRKLGIGLTVDDTAKTSSVIENGTARETPAGGREHPGETNPINGADEEDGSVEGPRVEAHVELSRRYGTSLSP
ncbi:hypothetical protein BD410DRAFT_847352 [Rickenella mellea]|uniref:Uncharacterized protein n=1 Tax=Rickenella mellea TaxID=50990 RepID=A0A4Y7PFH5_9AGAM|nr:hypothetical protein BD410DRAFT_847352 [Rickenella mellea]